MKAKTYQNKLFEGLFLFIFSCFFSGNALLAQDCKIPYAAKDIPHIPHQESRTNNSIQQITQYLEVDLNGLDRPFLGDKKTAYQERFDYLKGLLKDDYFLFVDSLQNVIDRLGTRLLEANDISNGDRIRFLIARSGIPNASCWGEGTIVVNSGLLTHLKNTDQLAFILAHELAHYHFDHVNENIYKRIEFLNSKETNKKITAAREGKEMAKSTLKDWLKENALDDSRHSRTHELSTDSLGMIFYLKAKFPPQSALSVLQLLESVDEASIPMADLKTYFNFSDYPWKESWGVSHLSGLSLVKISDEEKKLLRTHPEVEERVAQAIKILGDQELNEGENLCFWKKTLELEILERNYETRNLFATLLQGLRISGNDKINLYANGLVAHCLLDLCEARKYHNFGKFIPSPNSRMREDYFRLATFLDNLSFTNLKNITQRWCRENCSTIASEEMKTALDIKLTQMQNDFVIEKAQVLQFQNKWPRSIYFTKSFFDRIENSSIKNKRKNKRK